MRPSPGACRRSMVLASLFLARLAVATDDAPETQTASSAQLEEMVAPIALYPDSLLSQLFVAATYPIEMVEAARWQRKNASLKDDALDAALDEEPWDDSVEGK